MKDVNKLLVYGGFAIGLLGLSQITDFNPLLNFPGYRDFYNAHLDDVVVVSVVCVFAGFGLIGIGQGRSSRC